MRDFPIATKRWLCQHQMVTKYQKTLEKIVRLTHSLRAIKEGGLPLPWQPQDVYDKLIVSLSSS